MARDGSMGKYFHIAPTPRPLPLWRMSARAALSSRSSPSLLVASLLSLLSFPAFAQLSNKRLSLTHSSLDLLEEEEEEEEEEFFNHYKNDLKRHEERSLIKDLKRYAQLAVATAGSGA